MSFRCTAVAIFAVVAIVGPVHAASPASLPDIEDEVMCTVCGTPLNQAQSPQAERQRVFIRRLIADGESKDDIKAALKEEYGPAVLALPDDDGFGIAVYLVPIGLLLAALAGLAFALPRWRGRAGSDAGFTGSAAPPLSDADSKRLDEDLARYDA